MSIRPLVGEGEVRATQDATTALASSSWLDAAVVFDHRRWTCPKAEVSWTAPSHLIVLTQKGGTSRTSIRCAGSLLYDGRDRPGALSFVPGGVERAGSYHDADLVYSALWLDPRLTCLAPWDPARLPILLNANDTVVSVLLSSLQEELVAGHRPDAVYVEHLIALVMHRIAALGGARPLPGKHRKLNRTTVSRIQDYVEAHLGEEISLKDMAALAGMQSDSFARRFKAATGLAPYAFVVERRLRRAESLLRRPEMTLAAIALNLGFSSQSHFTTTFSRHRGTTPHAYRRQFLPES